MDYVSKWVETVALPTNDAKLVLRFLHTNIFTRFGTHRALISGKGSHFDCRLVANALNKYEFKHKIAMAYHPQTNGQAKISNREIKQIQEKVFNPNLKDWSVRLDEDLWAYRTNFKTPLGMSPVKLVYAFASTFASPLTFFSKLAKEKYHKNISKRPFCMEKRFVVQDAPFMGYTEAISSIVEKHGWGIFCLHPDDVLPKVVKEFYAHITSFDNAFIYMRGASVLFDEDSINAQYGLSKGPN
ncbi:uncharacterized protein [Gossypium hirsutum]|uniref:Integrase catalytic domain-containing protein n=1 Tax=Gossypium hirsutum TaxID=3635 RepID=A0A1U8KP05_GOSHI|nr:uncharacterized protein LOC107919203 [Gossypium hirsutum]